MANQIILKKSSVAGKIPLATDLAVGEIAVNLADKALYSKDVGGTVIQLGGGSGSGDVVGPSSATDNAITRFDGTTGKLIQNSTATLSDTGNLDTTSVKADYIDLDTTASLPSYAQGRMYWDSGNLTPSIDLTSSTTIQLGQENVALVYNGTGSTITAGSVVAVSGAQGQRPSVVLADADSESLSAPTLGIATESIANGAEGFVTVFGFVRGLNTSAFTAGAPIYLSQTAGQFTATRPSAPAHTVTLGWVIKVNASSGEVFVNINNGWELDELHNVKITSVTGGQLLSYDQTNSYWKNTDLTAGTGISVSAATGGTITVTNSAPDQTVAISGTSPVSVTGTYPTFTVSMTQSSGSVNGWLSSTDWTTFNGKQTAYTNLSTIGALANGTGWLYNNGSGTFSYSTPTKSDVGLGNVTNDAQTKAAIVPNTAPTTGQILVGNAGGTAYAPVSMSGDSTLASTGALTLATVNSNVGSFTNASVTVNGKGLITAVSSGTAPVTSVTGTSPISSSGGATPAISISQATTSTNGYLSSTDWTTFNNKGSGTVTSITSTTLTVGGTSAIPTVNLTSGIATAGTTGSSTLIPVVTIDTYGRVTGITTASNPQGTVTSVGGTGTVSGLTLTGTVTSSGNLTLGGNLTIAGDMIYDSFTATASQTTFTTSTTYTSGKIDVYCNGVRMINGTDVTVTSGTQVVFATGLTVGSLVSLVYPT